MSLELLAHIRPYTLSPPIERN